MMFGVAHGDAKISLSPFRIYNDEITVLGSMAVLHSYGPALELMAAGAIDAKSMLTHDFPLDGFADALANVREGRGVSRRSCRARSGASAAASIRARRSGPSASSSASRSRFARRSAAPRSGGSAS